MACPDSEHGVRIPAMEQGGQVKKVMGEPSGSGRGWELVVPNPRLKLMVFRFTIIWESMIVIMREKRAEVIEIIWERVKPRAA